MGVWILWWNNWRLFKRHGTPSVELWSWINGHTKAQNLTWKFGKRERWWNWGGRKHLRIWGIKRVWRGTVTSKRRNRVDRTVVKNLRPWDTNQKNLRRWVLQRYLLVRGYRGQSRPEVLENWFLCRLGHLRHLYCVFAGRQRPRFRNSGRWY
jgi:hypothetical protein